MTQPPDITLCDGPLPQAAAWGCAGAGAVLGFEGVVRPKEGGQRIEGLRYETYDPMAARELERLAHEAVSQFGLLAIRVEHSRGVVRNGECSFRLRVASLHRKEGLAAADWFIDRMKAQVPIWKRPLPAGTASEATP